MIFLQISALLVLLGFSALFSMIEAALTALSVLRMKKIVFDSPSFGPLFHEWLSRPHRLLTFLMVGNNVVGLGFSSLAAVMAVPLNAVFPSGAVSGGVWVVVTLLLLVVGDLIPKIAGRAYRERVASFCLPVVSRLSQMFDWWWGPVGWVLGRWAPTFRQTPVGALTEVSVDELQHAVVESEESGHLTEDSGDMFRRTLALAHRTARDVAQPADRIDSVALEILDRPGGADLLVDLLVETGRTRVPVTRGGNYTGYLNAMDFIRHPQKSAPLPAVTIEKMIRPLRRVGPEAKALDLLEDFRREGDGMVLVGDVGSAVVGFVTLEDILEEVVGEILDEYDREEAP